VADGRKVGLELEFPVVHATTGKGIDRAAAQAAWPALAQRDASWSLHREPLHGVATGVRRRRDGFTEHLDSDTGVCTVEIALGPRATVTRAVDEARVAMCDLGRALGDGGHVLLSAGLQPITWFDARRKTRKDWYELLARRWHFHHWMVPLASHQVSVDVSPTEAARALNVLCGLAGAFVALTASSPIARGARGPWKETRNWVWHERAARVPPAEARYTSNALPDAPFRDLGDVIDYAWGSQVYFLTDLKTEGFEALGGRSFRDVLLRGEAGSPARATDGTRVVLTPTRDMLDRIHQYGWLAAKLHYRFDADTTLDDVRSALERHEIGAYCEAHMTGTYIENRSCGVAPFGEEGAAAALTVGLVEMLDDAEALLSERPWEAWRDLWLLASEGALELLPADVLRTIGELLELARSGLRARGADEEAQLEPLFDRLDSGRVPADRMLETFARGGVRAVVDQFALADLDAPRRHTR